MIEELLEGFDSSLLHAVEEVVGWRLEERQRKQVELTVADSGLGLRMGRSVADISYVASKAKTYDSCVALDKDYLWDAVGGMTWKWLLTEMSGGPEGWWGQRPGLK